MHVARHARCCWPRFTLTVPGMEPFVLSSSDVAALDAALVAHGCTLPLPTSRWHDAKSLQRLVNLCLSSPEGRPPTLAWLAQRTRVQLLGTGAADEPPRDLLGPSGRPLLFLGAVAEEDGGGGGGGGGGGVVEAVVLLHQHDGPLPQGVAYVRWPSDAGWTYPGEADRCEQAAQAAALRWRGRPLKLRLARCYQEAWRKPKPRRCRARVLQPGCVLLKNAMDAAAQAALIGESRGEGGGEGEGGAGFDTPVYEQAVDHRTGASGDDGAVGAAAAPRAMRLRMRCLGRHWHHQSGRYSATRPGDHLPVPPIPPHWSALAAAAVARATKAEAVAARGRGGAAAAKAEAAECGGGGSGGGEGGGGSGGGGGVAEDEEEEVEEREEEEEQGEEGAAGAGGFVPDIVIVNEYSKAGALGLHQDKDESAPSLAAGTPVVSVSLGAACDFVFGPPTAEVGGPPPPLSQCQFVRLYSGDLLVFGGASRLMFHGVKGVLAGSAPKYLRLPDRGLRLNLTFRQF